MKVLIVEDENAAARRLKKLLAEIDENIEVLEVLDGIESSIEWFRNNKMPELIFMDIHLSDGPCFEIFGKIDLDVPVIFTTAYDEYALKAFEVNSIDYLLKPINREKLQHAFSKFQKLGKPSEGSPVSLDVKQVLKDLVTKPNQRITIKIGQKIKIIYLKDIAYCYTADKVTFATTNDGKRYPVDLTLEKLEHMLSPDEFFRINRQFLIGLNAIAEMYAYSKSRVKITLNPPCELEAIVSVERSSRFKKWLEGE